MNKKAVTDVAHDMWEIHKIATEMIQSLLGTGGVMQLPPPAVLLAMYNVLRLQVVTNLQRGTITADDIKHSKVIFELLKDPETIVKKFGSDGRVMSEERFPKL